MDCLDGSGSHQQVLGGIASSNTVVPQLPAVTNSSTNVIALPPFHYLINEQAKSILALQELQNEVGALLEFRDLVIESFPHLRQKTALSSSVSSTSVTSALISPKWEPGIRVKRKLGQQTREQEASIPSLIPRYRSNSHGRSPKSGDGSSSSATSSAIQDSGFCMESKEHSTAGISTRKNKDMDDELWSLLDVIHQKGTRLKLQVQHLQTALHSHETKERFDNAKRKCRSLDDLIVINKGKDNEPIADYVARKSALQSEVLALKKERDLLIDKITEMKREHIDDILRKEEHNNIQSEFYLAINKLRTNNNDTVLYNNTNNINNNHNHNHSNSNSNNIVKINRNNVIGKSQPFNHSSQTGFIPISDKNGNNIQSVNDINDICICNQHCKPSQFCRYCNRNDDRYNTTSCTIRPSNPLSKKVFTECIRDEELKNTMGVDIRGGNWMDIIDDTRTNAQLLRKSSSANKIKLGKLDGIVSDPSEIKKIPKGPSAPTEKITAILDELNPTELQRHLLTLTFLNQSLSGRIDRVSKSKCIVTQQLHKFKEENDDLKFQLEEKNIQLEGTRARVRMLERLQKFKLNSSPPSGNVAGSSSMISASQHILLPNNPIMSHLALPNDPVSGTLNDITQLSNCTDFANDENILSSTLIDEKIVPTPRKRPSKIPLKSSSPGKSPTTNTYKVAGKDEMSASWQKHSNESISRNWDSSKNSDLSVTKSYMKEQVTKCTNNNKESEGVKFQDVYARGNKGLRKSTHSGSNYVMESGTYSSTNTSTSSRLSKDNKNEIQSKRMLLNVCNSTNAKSKNAIERSLGSGITSGSGSNAPEGEQKRTNKKKNRVAGQGYFPFQRKQLDKVANSVLPAVREVQEPELDAPDVGTVHERCNLNETSMQYFDSIENL